MKKQVLIGIASAVLATGSVAFAAPTVSTTWGALPEATWSGSGIPNNPSEIVTITDGNDSIKMGLSATQRYFNPMLQNDANTTTFTATTGLNDGTRGGHPLGATWNYDFYVLNSGGSLANYTFALLIQTTPGGAFITLPLSVVPGTATQDSSNLAYSGIPPFDPYAYGIYDFKLEALTTNPTTGGQVVVATDEIFVNVVPEVSSTGILFALALGGLGVYSRVRRQSVA